MQNELDSASAAYRVNGPITTVNSNLSIRRLTEISVSNAVVVPDQPWYEEKAQTLYTRS